MNVVSSTGKSLAHSYGHMYAKFCKWDGWGGEFVEVNDLITASEKLLHRSALILAVQVHSAPVLCCSNDEEEREAGILHAFPIFIHSCYVLIFPLLARTNLYLYKCDTLRVVPQ